MRAFARRQIFLSVIFLVLSLALFLAMYIYASNTILERQEQLITLQLENVELDVQRFYDEYFYAIHDVSEYISLFGTGGLEDFLVSINSHHDDMLSIYFGTIDNEMFNSSGFVPGPEFDLRTRIWYTLATDKDAMIITPAFLNATQNHIISTVAMPVYDQSNVLLGVLAVDIKIDTINDYMINREIGKTGYAILVDQVGHIVAHPSLNEINGELIHKHEFGIYLEDYELNALYRDYNLNQSIGTMIYHDMFDGTYQLIVFMPNAEYYQTQRQFFNYFAFVLFFIIAIGLTYIWMDFKHIFSPMNHLLNDLSKLDIKENISYRLSDARKDSFHQLRKTVNFALDDAESYYHEARLKAEELYLENQRFKYLIDSTQDFIFQVDKKLNIVYASGSGLRKIGFSKSKYINQHVAKLLDTEDVDHTRIIKSVLDGENAIYDWKILNHNKTYIFETSASPIYDPKHNIIGVVLISRDITDAKKRQEEIEYINEHDYLTDLYNRRVFIETFEKYSEDKSYPITFMMIDLNGLKILNDAFGHKVGDEALISVGNVFKKVFKNHFVARIGGDEFAVLIKGLETKEVEEIKRYARDEVSKIKINEINLSVSMGYRIMRDDSLDINEVMKAAENHMYRHKVTESMSVRNQAIKAIHKTLTDKYKEERIHSEKVSQLCYVTGLALGIRDEQLQELKLAGMYHDIGKIAIPDAILDKPDKLTTEEFEIMKTHTESGYHILRAADDYSRLAEYALSHHERWDGKGYPRGLSGEDIPLISRIINLCDSYDAMTTNRVYRSKMSKDEAVQEIIKGSGKQYDPKLAKIFVEKVLKRTFIKS